MTDAEALDAIQAAMLDWAKMIIDDQEVIARTVETLEKVGRRIITDIAAPANDA